MPGTLHPILQALKDSLQRAITAQAGKPFLLGWSAQGQLVVDTYPQTIGSGSRQTISLSVQDTAVKHVLEQVLSNAQLSFEAPHSLAASGADSLQLTGIAAEELFGIASMKLSCNFGLIMDRNVAKELRLFVTVTPPDSLPWRLSSSFYEFEGTFFDRLNYDKPAFVIVSHPYKEPNLKIDLVQGINFYMGSKDLRTGPLAPVLQLITGDMAELPLFHGHIEAGETFREFEIGVDFPEIRLQIADVPLLAVKDGRLILTNQYSIDPPYKNRSILVKGKARPGSLDLELPIALTMFTDQNYATLHLYERTLVADYLRFLNLIPNFNLSELIPADLKSVINTVYLTTFGLGFDVSNKAFDYFDIGFSIGDESRPLWPIIPNVVELTRISCEFRIQRRLSELQKVETHVSGYIAGVFEFGDRAAKFQLEVFFHLPYDPNWPIVCELPAGKTVGIKKVATALKLSLPNDIPDISFSTLKISVVPGTGRFNLSAQSSASWPIVNELSIETFDLDFTRDPSNKNNPISGHINTSLKIATVTPDLRASINEISGGGWRFSGNTGKDHTIPIGNVIRDLATKFGLFDSSVPNWLEGLTILNLGVSFNTKSKDFTFSLETKFSIDQKELDAVISIKLTHNNDKYTRQFSGIVKVGELEFDLIFQQEQAADTLFLAAFENKAGKDETIKALVELITDNADILSAADGLSFNLKDALLVVDKGAETKILFGLDIGGGLDLSKLPMVGKTFPTISTVRMTFQPLLTNKEFAAADLNKVRPLVPTGGFQLPQEAKERLGFNMQLLIGNEAIDLNLPIDINAVKNQPATISAPATNTASSATTTASPPATTANIKWFVIQKQLGPVNFGRVGIQFQDSQLYFLLDASLSLTGLTISLDGLFASSKLKPIHPEFGLHGLGIDYKKGPLEIGGAFLRQTVTEGANTFDTYDGTAIIRTEKLALAALGSYAYYQGHPSLFIYAFVDVPLGGPAFFFVTGLAAGFGYNRRIVVPGIDGVSTFPLVAEAMSGVPGKTNDLSAEINKLHNVIPPAVGEYFLAVGIRFSSFKIIDSFVLLTVSFGQEFEVDVLGLSTLVIPTPDATQAIEPLAEVQMALKAVFNPDKGYLTVRAGLTSASFILSRNCHLTGGFAFYTWFKDNPEEGAAAGDFILTLGGYHPRFKPPTYYPRIASLGFNWPVTRELLIKGDFYFALVSSAVMAGGHLSATWTSGNLKAWFRVGADFIISWKPYFYDASMYLDMGVSYTFHLFGTHHISVDVGADLHIWGPDFSGQARVHLWIVTFDVTFGAGNKQVPPALSWDEFRQGFLPKDTKKWASVSVTKGLIKQLGDKNDPLFVINPKDFMLETVSALPVTKSNNSDLAGVNKKINIGSMKIVDDKVVSKHNITIKKGTRVVTSEFTIKPVKKNVPSALWGSKFRYDSKKKEVPPSDGAVKNACMGFSIKGKPIVPSRETHDVASEKLLNENEDFGKRIAYGTPATLGGDWLKASGARKTVAKEIEAKTTERNALLKALDFQETFHPNKELADEFIIGVAA